MNQERLRLLLVEDETDLGNVLKQYIELAEFSVTLCRSGEEAIQVYRTGRFDLGVLDVMLPGMDGFALAREIRKRDPDFLLVFLTARGQKPDRLKGLELGADDYICKPFEVDEFMLRIRNILRRSRRVSGSSGCEIGSFRLDSDDLRLERAGKFRRLTKKEAELLRLLAENRNRLVRRREILKTLWGDENFFYGRSLDVFITRLRKYLRDDECISLQTVRGAGYILRTSIHGGGKMHGE